MTPALETRRLLLPPLALADAGQVQALFPRWEIVRYMTAVVPWPYPPDGALIFFREVALPAMERDEAWHWTLRRKEEPDRIVGSIGLNARGEDHRGFWVAPAWQGRGYATEACAAVTAFWFEVLRFPVMRVSKTVANEPSRRITRGEGMRHVGTELRDFVSGRLPAERWEMTAEEWRRRRAAAEPGAKPGAKPGA